MAPGRLAVLAEAMWQPASGCMIQSTLLCSDAGAVACECEYAGMRVLSTLLLELLFGHVSVPAWDAEYIAVL